MDWKGNCVSFELKRVYKKEQIADLKPHVPPYGVLIFLFTRDIPAESKDEVMDKMREEFPKYNEILVTEISADQRLERDPQDNGRD